MKKLMTMMVMVLCSLFTVKTYGDVVAMVTDADCSVTEYETLDAALDALEGLPGGTLDVLSACSSSKLHTFNGNAVIDLGGNTVEVNASSDLKDMWIYCKGSSFTFRNGTVEFANAYVTGMVDCEGSTAYVSNVTCNTDSPWPTVIVEKGGTGYVRCCTFGGSDRKHSGVSVDGSGSKCYVVGTTISVNGLHDDAAGPWRSAPVRVSNNGSVNVTDCALSVVSGGRVAQVLATGGSITLESGTFVGQPFMDGTGSGKSGNFYIAGGVFTNVGSFGVRSGSSSANFKYHITGGTFDADPSSYVDTTVSKWKKVDNNWVVFDRNMAQVTDAQGTVTKYDSLDEAMGALAEGGTLKLLADATGDDKSTAVHTISCNATIDLNGKEVYVQYSASAEKPWLTFSGSGKTLTLKNGSVSIYNVKSSGDWSTSYCVGIVKSTAGTLNVEDIECLTDTRYPAVEVSGGEAFVRRCDFTEGNRIYAGVSAAGGTVTVEDTDITIAKRKSDSVSSALRVTNKGTLVVKSGHFVAPSVQYNSSSSVSPRYLVNVATSGGTITVEGGTFDGGMYLDGRSGKEASATITGGTFTNMTFGRPTTSDKQYSTYTVEGGTFDADPSSYVDTTKYDCKQIGTNWVVSEKESDKPIKIVETNEPYDTLQEAVDAVEDGQTIKLMRNITSASAYNTMTLSAMAGKSFTVDLNGKVISNNPDCKLKNAKIFNLAPKSMTSSIVITVKNGTIDGAGNDNYLLANIFNVVGKGSDKLVTLNIQGVTIHARGSGANAVVKLGSYSRVNVSSCTFDGWGETNAKIFDLSNLYDAQVHAVNLTSTVTVKPSGSVTGDNDASVVVTAQSGRSAGVIFDNCSITGGNSLCVMKGASSTFGTMSLAINGGTYSGAISAAGTSTTVAITGGTFDVKPPENSIVSGYECKKVGDKWVVAEEVKGDAMLLDANGEKVASGTFDEMLPKLSAGQTLKMIVPTATTTKYRSISFDATIDLGGNHLTVDANVSDGYAWLTFTGSGTLSITNGTISILNAGYLTTKAVGIAEITGGGTLRVTDITCDTDTRYPTIQGGAGTSYIKGCNFGGSRKYSGVSIYGSEGYAEIEDTVITVTTLLDYRSSPVRVSGGGRAKIISGTYTIPYCGSGLAVNKTCACAYVCTSSGKITIEGGTFNRNGGFGYAAILTHPNDGGAKGNAELNIKGGNINAPLWVQNDQSPRTTTMTITGGTFTNFSVTKESANNKCNIYGGTFDADPTSYVVADYQVKPNTPSAGWWTVGAKVAVAKIGSTMYYSLAEAMTEAVSGQTVALVAACAENVTLKAGVSFDEAGYAYTGTVSAPEKYETVKTGTVWTVVRVYTISFTTDKGTAPDNITYKTLESNLALPKPDYSSDTETFGGWLFPGEGGVVANEVPAGTAADLALTATWVAAQGVSVKESKESQEPTLTIKVTKEWVDANVKSGESVQDKLNETAANGNMVWQNYVIGLDNAKVASGAAVENGKENQLKVVPNAVAPMADTGYTVTYALDEVKTNGTIIASGVETTAEGLGIDLAKVESNSYFRIKMTVKKDGQTEGTELTTTNIIGVMKVSSPTTKTIVAIPWGAFTESETDKKSIYVTNIIQTANLTRKDDNYSGDELHVYRSTTEGGKNEYDTWYLDFDGTWEPAKGNSSTDPRVSRGSAVWLVRKDPSKPFYLYGQVAKSTEPASTTIEPSKEEGPSWNLVAPPVTTAVNLNEKFDSSDDQIIIPTVSVPISLKNDSKKGGWGYMRSYVDDKGYIRRAWTNQTTVTPGTGFWYLNKGEKAKSINW